MPAKLSRQKSVWLCIGGLTLIIVALVEFALVSTGNRILLNERIVRPGQTYDVDEYGDLGRNKQASLVCSYFSGRHISKQVYWYSSANQLGRNECPFVFKPVIARDDAALESGALADWVSGIGSLLAVLAALLGYFLVELQRRKDGREKLQGHIYQIGYKLSMFASEARTTLRDLNSKGLPLNELLEEKEPLWVVGGQAGVRGYDYSMVRDLTDAEQNLLMLMREEEFLMDFTECFARNEAVRSSFVEYGKRRDELVADLPQHDKFVEQTGTFSLSKDQYEALLPKLIPTSELMRHARYLANLNVEMITKLCDNFMPMMKRHYPTMHIHKIELIEVPPAANKAA